MLHPNPVQKTCKVQRYPIDATPATPTTTDHILGLLDKHQLTLADLQTVVAASGRDPEELLLDNPHMQSRKDATPSPRRTASVTSQQSASLTAAIHNDPPESDAALVLSRSRSSTPRGARSIDAADAAALALAATVNNPTVSNQTTAAKATQEFVSALRAAATAAGMSTTETRAATPPRGGLAGGSAAPPTPAAPTRNPPGSTPAQQPRSHVVHPSDDVVPLPSQPTPPAAVRMQPGQRPRSLLDAPQASSWEDTDTLARRIRDAARPVPKPVPTWRRQTLTLLVAGGHSLGKSTLIANLLASYTPTPSPSAASSDDGAAQFHASQCAVVEVADEAERVVYCLTLQETSPLGSVGALAEVERALGKGNLAGMDGGGEGVVDAVLYLMPPHHVDPKDVAVITSLSQHAPIIPLLAKADTMTVSEAHNHQRRVQQALQQAESSANRVLVHRFRGDDLDAAGILFGGPPFLVMCSETFDASLGRYAPIREYPWGVAEALRHSDLTAVKRLIFEVAFEELKTNTAQRLQQQRHATRRRRHTRRLLALLALSGGALWALLTHSDAPQPAPVRRSTRRTPAPPAMPVSPHAVPTQPTAVQVAEGEPAPQTAPPGWSRKWQPRWQAPLARDEVPEGAHVSDVERVTVRAGAVGMNARQVCAATATTAARG